MRLTYFTHLLLSLLLCVAAFAAYGVWYHIVDTKSVQAATLAANIQAKSQESTRTAAAKNELEALSKNEAGVRSYFVSTTDVVPFLTSIESTGRSFNTNVSVVSVSATNETPHGHLVLALSITGSFDSVMRTLGALEYAPYDITLQSVTLDTSQTATASEWTANATFFIGTVAPGTAVASSTKP